MGLEQLIDLVHSSRTEQWLKRNEEAFSALFGSAGGRYPKAAMNAVTLRAPEMSVDSGVPFAAYIHPSNPRSGPYSGLSFVVFPAAGHPCLIGMIIGTQGLSPDEIILGRPGHARKMRAICAWLNQEYGKGSFVAWAKQDPTRTDISVPDGIREAWPEYKNIFDRYGREMYALYRPTDDSAGIEAALTAFLDILFEERGFQPIASGQDSYRSVQASWFEYLMPSIERREVADLLAKRKFVIVQGPPGTGKTRMAMELLANDYHGHGTSIQFHPNTAYENFIGGLAPDSSTSELGLRFAPAPGFLMQAAAQALREPTRNYLLHIDEINRADLAKVLGEAIFLFESGEQKRVITLPYDFGEPFGTRFFLPENLHIVGTMNNADRSIAIVDVAVRRRFAFVSLWPRMSVVQEHGCKTMQEAFQELVSIFVEHATDDAFPLVPGHSYFLESSQAQAPQRLRVSLVPLLQEYLAQGYAAGFAEPIRAYLQRIESL